MTYNTNIENKNKKIKKKLKTQHNLTLTPINMNNALLKFIVMAVFRNMI